MDQHVSMTAEKFKCFRLVDPRVFRRCLCEEGVGTFCSENATASEDTFWDWDPVDYSDKHSSTVRTVVVQRRDYENNATQSWGLFMILMGMFPIGVLFVCFFVCNYRRRWLSRSSLPRPWPSSTILEAGRATPASLSSAELEPLVSPPATAAPLVSPEPSTSPQHAPVSDAPPAGREAAPAGPPPSYSQTLLELLPPSYEIACREDRKGAVDAAD